MANTRNSVEEIAAKLGINADNSPFATHYINQASSNARNTYDDVLTTFANMSLDRAATKRVPELAVETLQYDNAFQNALGMYEDAMKASSKRQQKKLLRKAGHAMRNAESIRPTMTTVATDNWDLQPFSGVKLFPKKLRNWQALRLVNGFAPSIELPMTTKYGFHPDAIHHVYTEIEHAPLQTDPNILSDEFSGDRHFHWNPWMNIPGWIETAKEVKPYL